MRLPKILIATPTANYKDYCLEKWAAHIKDIDFPEYDILIVDNSRDEKHPEKIQKAFEGFKKGKSWVVHSPPKKGQGIRSFMCDCNNIIREFVLDENYDFLYSVESDIFPPKDFIWTLLFDQQRVVGMPYFTLNGKNTRMLIQDVDEYSGAYSQSKYKTLEESFHFFDGKTKEAYQFGIGCMKIHRSILQQFKFRIEPGTDLHADSYFHEDLRKAEVKVFLNTSAICRHENSDWNKIYSKEKM